VIRAQVELLDRETDERKRHEGTVTLLRRLDQLDRLVGDMLTLASAEAGQLIEPEEIDLHDYFEDLRRDLPLFGDREFRVQPIAGTLDADPDRLTQVLRNLVRNAVAHTKRGDRVSVLARAHNNRLEISVSDTGPGIPPDELERIFERFHRVDGSRSRDRGGSGLGLAIARAIVEAHGGSIRAESDPGNGAVFRIDLPRYRPSEGPDQFTSGEILVRRR
jgi:two-component system sensor histidine kinase ResE